MKDTAPREPKSGGQVPILATQCGCKDPEVIGADRERVTLLEPQRHCGVLAMPPIRVKVKVRVRFRVRVRVRSKV